MSGAHNGGKKPRLLDLFCGAGGAAMGYHRAGFEVVGVDTKPQPNYPFEFHEADALDVLESLRDGGHWYYELGGDFQVVHASPPCQAYSSTQVIRSRKHPALIAEAQEGLASYGVPSVLENVEGARTHLHQPSLLCGTMFGLDLRRHRLFEVWLGSEPLVLMTPPCSHGNTSGARYPTHERKDKNQESSFVYIYGTGGGAGKDINLWRSTMDVPWMQTKAEISEAIPPAYTELIGHQLMAHLKATVAA